LIHADYSSAELREPEKFNTIDPLHDPATAAEHAELQCVIPPLSFVIMSKLFFSEEGKGLFTLAGAAMGFAPSRVVSPRSPELQERLREHIARSKVSYSPGLYEQYEQHYNLIKLGSPDVEILAFPGFIGSPSKFSSNVALAMSQRLT